MANTTKRTKIDQNAIFVTPGDAESGLLNIVDLASAQQFRDRFLNGTYTVPADSPINAPLREMIGVTVNEDGSVTRPEVFGMQGNGYDSYASKRGLMRRTQAAQLGAQGLGKIVLIALDELHQEALSEDQEVASDAQTVLAVLREFDGVAAKGAAETIAAQKRERAVQALVENGISREQAENMLNAANPAPQQVPTLDEVPANKSSKRRKQNADAVESEAVTA